ncbi:hypothetical protein IC582_006988 [Cucumis melo]
MMMKKMIILPNCSLNQKPSIHPPSKLPHFSSSNLSIIIPTEKVKKTDREIIPLKVDVFKKLKTTWMKLLDGFVDSVFEFSDQTLHPNQEEIHCLED